MTPPLVSVLVVTYNHRGYIREALESAADQDYPNIEVVVADDGSSDGTDAIVLEVAAKYPPGRIVPIVGDGHLGITGNCNRVLKRCRGKYLSLFAGDDVMLPGKISRQVEWLEDDESRVACGHDVEIFESESGDSLGLFSRMMALVTGKGAAHWVEHQSPFPPLSIMLRMSAVPEHGFDDRLRIASDWKFWIDCVAAGGAYGYVDGVYTRYRRHATSALTFPSSQRYEDAFTTLALVEARYPHLVGSVARSRRKWFIWRALTELSRHEPRAARSYLRSATAGRALLNWKLYAAWVLALLPQRLSTSILSRPRVFKW